MSNQPKKSRTLIVDLPASEQELNREDMENVQGGGLHSSSSNTAAPVPPSPATPLTPPPPPTGDLKKAPEPKNKDKQQ